VAAIKASGEVMAQKLRTVREIQSDQQFQERRRLAERLVEELRAAGYSCELGEDGPPLKPLN